MKFIIEKKELSLLTMMVHKAASNKNVVPVLSGLLLQVSHQNGITMTATDMEIGIKASSHRLEIMEEGTVLVNANYFADLIKVLPETSITIELDQLSSKLNIAYGRSSVILTHTGNMNIPICP
jgi:DNA polymerase-3 subunit beta